MELKLSCFAKEIWVLMLLIVPYGIEISLAPFMPSAISLLIVPYGIEMQFLPVQKKMGIFF